MPRALQQTHMFPLPISSSSSVSSLMFIVHSLPDSSFYLSNIPLPFLYQQDINIKMVNHDCDGNNHNSSQILHDTKADAKNLHFTKIIHIPLSRWTKRLTMKRLISDAERIYIREKLTHLWTYLREIDTLMQYLNITQTQLPFHSKTLYMWNFLEIKNKNKLEIPFFTRNTRK